MIPRFPRPAITRSQKIAALCVAAMVDFIQLPGFAIFGEGALSLAEDGLDVFAAVVLTAICGFRWQLALAFITELLPFVDLFPTWTAVVLSLPVESRRSLADEAQRVSVTPVEVRDGANPAGERVVVDGEVIAVPPVQR